MTLCERCGSEADAGDLDGLCPRCVWTQVVDTLPARWDDEPSLDEGRRLGDYTILGQVARGGMGVVYRARQESVGREVALKVLSDPDALARFRREIALSAKLDHPNIVPVHDAGEADGVHFLAMAFVEGPTLDEARLAPRAALEVVRKLALAVQFAHDRGVLHRDLKPGNVILADGREPRITDFGLAREVGASPSLTVSGIAMGTPPYAAPELVSGRLEDVDARTDVYALGAVLYHALAGRPPFEGRTAGEVIARVLAEDPPPLAADPDAAAICAKAMDKDRAARYASAREMADDLERALAGRPIVARRAGALDRLARRVRGNRALSVMIVLCAVLAALNLLPYLPKGYVRQARSIADRLEAARSKSPVDAAAVRALDREFADLRRGVVGTPEDRDLLYEMARCHVQLNQRVRAVEYLSRRLAQEPEFAPAIEARARLWLREYLERRGMPDEPESPAARVIGSLIQEEAARARSATLSALLAAVEDHASGRPAEARNKLGISIGSDPGAWFLDGRCARMLGRMADAERSFERALELDPALQAMVEKERSRK